MALWREWRLARRVMRDRGFRVVQVCNPPDLLFVVAAWFKLVYGTRMVFDHHDISPELYEAKYGRRDVFYQVLRLAERLTFATADVVIATNESYRAIALTRGRKRPDDVFVVRNGPDLSRFVESAGRRRVQAGPPLPRRVRRHHGRAGGDRPPAARRAHHRP